MENADAPAARARDVTEGQSQPESGHESARRACHDVLVAYLSAVDHHRATTVLDLFAERARIVARGQHLEGREAISRFLAEREADIGRQTAHLIVNEVFDHVEADQVVLSARVVLLLLEPGGGYRVDQIVETTQTFRPAGAGWCITERAESPLHPAS